MTEFELVLCVCACALIYFPLQRGRENKRERNINSCTCLKSHLTVRSFLELVTDPPPVRHKVCRKILFCFFNTVFRTVCHHQNFDVHPGAELDNPYGPFQLELFCDSVISTLLSRISYSFPALIFPPHSFLCLFLQMVSPSACSSL